MENKGCTHCGTQNPGSSKYCSRCGYELPKVIVEEAKPEVPKRPSTKFDTKKIVTIITGIVTFTIFYFIGQSFFTKSPVSRDEQLKAMCQEINKGCPYTLDGNMRLNNVEALTGNSVQYNYTLVNDKKAQINVDVLKSQLEPHIIKAIKTNPDMKYIRENETTLTYNYSDKNKEPVLKIVVVSELYK